VCTCEIFVTIIKTSITSRRLLMLSPCVQYKTQHSTFPVINSSISILLTKDGGGNHCSSRGSSAEGPQCMPQSKPVATSFATSAQDLAYHLQQQSRPRNGAFQACSRAHLSAANLSWPTPGSPLPNPVSMCHVSYTLTAQQFTLDHPKEDAQTLISGHESRSLLI
jgi:hypothetical protein